MDLSYFIHKFIKILYLVAHKHLLLVGRFSANVAEISEITGKSIRTMYNGLSLLKLPDPIQMEFRTEHCLSLRDISSPQTSFVLIATRIVNINKVPVIPQCSCQVHDEWPALVLA
jgi:hypothetical protein